MYINSYQVAIEVLSCIDYYSERQLRYPGEGVCGKHLVLDPRALLISWLMWTWMMVGHHQPISGYLGKIMGYPCSHGHGQLDFTNQFLDNPGQSWDIMAHVDIDSWTSPTNFWISENSLRISWLTWTWTVDFTNQLLDNPGQSWDILAHMDIDGWTSQINF